MPLYVIVPLSHPIYSQAVLATSWQNPTEFLPDVERHLAACAAPGLVLFDLLLAVGVTSNRFLAGEFNGSHIVVWSVDRVSQQDVALCATLAAIYRAHPAWIAASVLSRIDRYRLRTSRGFATMTSSPTV